MLLRCLTVLLLFKAAPEKTIAAIQKENGADFQLLCAVVALASAEPDAAGVPDISDDKIQRLRQLNMSTADDERQEVFKGGSAVNKLETRQKKSGPEPFQYHWASTYDGWVKDKEKVDSESGVTSWLAQNPRPITAEGQRAAAEKINAILSRILSLQTTLRSKITEAKETKPNEAKAQLRQAVYGTGVADSKFDATKSIASASTWTSGCASNGGKSVIGDIMCICGTSGETADQCNSVAISFKWNGNNDDTVATAIKAKCPKAQAAKYTAATLHRLISTVTARIRYDKTGAHALVPYLGKTASGTPGTCDGTDGQSSVIYKFYTSSNGANTAGFDISWLNHLVLAADALEQAEKVAQRAKKMSEQVNDLETTCEEAYKAKRYNRQPAQATKSDVATSTAEKARQKTQCPRKNTTAEECPEAHCDYDATKKECKAKPGNENTGTGDGAPGAAASTGCVAHKDKTACENDKTGDKKNCAWRKEKDNGPDQEKEMCRSGSFLVNKKLALRMDVFMSLIAL